MSKGICVLAYSGGLDTSVCIRWIIENYDLDVVACLVEVGQEQDQDTDFTVAKALKIGAVESLMLNVQDEFADQYVAPAIAANALYENKYPLVSALSRPLISKALVKLAQERGASYIAHGCTGKGNDQVRFELAIKTFAPKLKVIAPWREWDIKSREDAIAYAEARAIPLRITRETNYSKDKNIWHLSHEGMDLEDPANEPVYDKILELGVSPEKAPDKAQYVTIDFKQGIPVAIDGKPMDGAALIELLNKLGGANGIGIIDMVENRLVGMKSRGVYETPGGTILYKAHALLESLTLDKDTSHLKDQLAIRFAELVYNGQWFTPVRQALSAFVSETQKYVTGQVKLKLYKGNIIPAGITSPYSLYDAELASFGESDYDHNDSAGFITLFGLPYQVAALLGREYK